MQNLYRARIGFLFLFLGCLLLFLNSPLRYVIQGEAQLKSGKAALAIKDLKEAAHKFPENKEILVLLLKAYVVVGEYNKVNPILLSSKWSDLNSLKPKTKKEFLNLLVDVAEERKMAGEDKIAISFANKYLSLEDLKKPTGETVNNLTRLGSVLDESKSVEVLEKAYKMASFLKSKDSIDTIKTILLPKYLKQVQNSRLEEKFDLAIQISNKAQKLGLNSELSFQRGLVYSESGRIELAKDSFEEALQIEPENIDYKIGYAEALKKAALFVNEESKKQEYLQQAMLLIDDNSKIKKADLLNKILNFNSKYKVTNANLKLSMIGEYLYPCLTFKVMPVQEVPLRKYKIIFFDANMNSIDQYEAPLTSTEVDRQLEVICRSPISNGQLISAKLFVNDEFIKDYSGR